MTTMTASGGRTRRAELAAFLRSRRERISPEDAGARFPCWAVHPQPGQQATRGAMETAGQG
jgi:hypothetical protein